MAVEEVVVVVAAKAVVMVMGLVQDLVMVQDLDMVKELYCLHSNFPEVPMSQLLEWACLNGARFLKKDDVLGSLTVGKKPGIVRISNVDAEGNLTADSTSKRVI